MSIKMKVTLTVTKTIAVDPEDFDWTEDEDGRLVDEDGDTREVEAFITLVKESIEDDYYDFIDKPPVRGEKEEVVVEVENKS